MVMRTGIAVVVVAFALSPVAASAVDLYANPNGTNNAVCGQADPCDIVTAVGNAKQGDAVIVEPGTYTPTMTLDDGGAGGPITIEGEQGLAPPVIDSSAGYAIELLEGSTVSYLDVVDHQNNSWGIWAADNPAEVDHVDVQVDGSNSGACYIDGSLIDSLCWANGTNDMGAAALIAGSVTANFRNDTIEATGSNDDGVWAYMASGSETLNLTNTIVHGTSDDIFGQAESGASATVTAAYSNFATVDNAGGGGTVSLPTAGSSTNQTAAPVFSEPGAGYFYELASSPTVGAGTDSSLNGATDLDGVPREINGKTDIGAYEFVPPPTCTSKSVSTNFQTAVTVQLQCTAVFNYPTALTYAIASRPAHGSVSTPTGEGMVSYTPANGFSGTDRFTYTGTGTGGTATAATITITVAKEPAPKLSGVKLSHKTVHFTLNEPAGVTLTFARKHHKSVTVKLNGKAGKNSYKIKKLKPGKYKLTIAASNAGGRTKSKSIGLKIKAKTKK